MKLLVFLLLPCLSLSEVGTDFSKCTEFFLKGVPPLLKLDSTIVKPICQCLWDDDGKQKFLYATLYNTAWRIPVYSAYVFKSASTGRCDPWFIEPQLLDVVADPCMGPQGRNQAIGKYQALNRDYKGSGSKYNKGHLYPVNHTDNSLSMLATSTLTNAAPQDSSFNQKQWKNHERDVITDLSGCKKAFVVTGVVPDLSKNINNRVLVSKYYWSATCCQDNNDKFKGKGYYGPDDTGELKSLSIADLQDHLAKDYGVNIVIFPGVPRPSDCSGDKVPPTPPLRKRPRTG